VTAARPARLDDPARVAEAGLSLLTTERAGAKGDAHLTGRLGEASVVALRGEPDERGAGTRDVFVATPEPRCEPRRAPAAGGGPHDAGPARLGRG